MRWYLRAEAQGDEPAARALEAICSQNLVPGCRGEVVVLLREDDGRIGKVLVTADDGTEVLLDDDFSTSRLGRSGSARAVDATSTDVESIFAAVLAEMPPEPYEETLYFVDGRARLTAASEPKLAALIARIRDENARRSTVEVDVVGHTDRVGEAADNDVLSRERADVVRNALLASGVDAERVKAFWRGERAPKIKTPDGVREARNRRVEVFVR